MPHRRPTTESFARSLADFAAMAAGTDAASETARTVTAAAEALASEFGGVVAALEERQALLERLAKIQRSITRRDRLQDTLNAIVAGAAELLAEPIAALRQIDWEHPDHLEVVSSIGIPPERVAEMRSHPIGTGAAGRAVAEGRMIAFEEYQSTDDATPSMVRHGVQAALAAPVRTEGRVIGALVVGSRRPGRRFTEYEREALTAFAEHASLALTDARMVADAIHRAGHDALTGLPNRTLFADRVQHALALARRRRSRVAVLFCDLDNFKVVNDSLGHLEGDHLLIAVAERLRGSLRESDTIARFGGDEFGILLEDVREPADAARVADGIGLALRAPVRVGARSHVIGASIGIALSTASTGSAEELVRDADAAMYRAKQRGPGCHEVFDEAMREQVLARLRTEGELRTAIGAGELRLALQPIVALADGRVLGAEALVRWQHPQRGLLAPGEFIAIAEESGVVVPLGDWVIHEACRHAATWADDALSVAVNLSPRQIAPALMDAVGSALAETGLEPSRLVLEITEGVLLQDSPASRDTVQGLKALGVSLVLDDFGTGFSSLGYLKRLPLDGLKIDRSFVGGLGRDPDDTAIVTAVAGMAASLGLTITAEGVETAAQAAELRRLGCQRAQGFHFARPMGPQAFAALAAAGLEGAANTMRQPCPSSRRPPSTR